MGRSDGVGEERFIVCLISPAFVSTEGTCQSVGTTLPVY